MAGRESLADRKKRAGRIVRALKKTYPDADCALTHKSAWELLLATILSAQSTDETVNKVMPVLLERCPTPDDLAGAKPDEVEALIRPTGFFRNKTKSIMGAATAVRDRFDGSVPDNMDDLLTLPGVARKTANVVLGTWFGKNVGVVVDTHVGRLSDRLRLAWRHKDSKDAVRIETDLMEVLPQKDWTYVSHALIWHGRRVCTARKPDCEACSLAKNCPSAGRVNGPAKKAG